VESCHADDCRLPAPSSSTAGHTGSTKWMPAHWTAARVFKKIERSAERLMEASSTGLRRIPDDMSENYRFYAKKMAVLRAERISIGPLRNQLVGLLLFTLEFERRSPRGGA
jgi:hypothetical protein